MNYNKDYYEILEISSNASEEVVKMAYKALVKKYHPDITKNSIYDEKIKDINEAYEILSDPQKRNEYDYIRNSKLNEIKISFETERKEQQYYNDKINKDNNNNNNIFMIFFWILVALGVAIYVISLLSLFMEELNKSGAKTLRQTVTQQITEEIKTEEIKTEDVEPLEQKNIETNNKKQTVSTPKHCNGGYKCSGPPYCSGAREISCQGPITKNCSEAYACAHGVYGPHDFNRDTQQFNCEGGKLCQHQNSGPHQYQENCMHGFGTAHSIKENCEHGFFASHRVGTCEHAFSIDHIVLCEHGYEQSHIY